MTTKNIIGTILSCLYGLIAYLLVSEVVWNFLKYFLNLGSAGHDMGLLAVSTLSGVLVAAYSIYALTRKKEQTAKFVPSTTKAKAILFSSIIIVFILILLFQVILIMGL
ncbi:MAG: hypothetical protein MJZ16_01600 [Bacteroidales bacterium]|nr:hypothetical protein [Bacteroidales bacterium]